MHRYQHSPHGGLFQPTMTTAIRLLSSPAPPLPAARHAWIHVFPEGMVHQDHAASDLRYFKWGVARLLLEAEPRAPDVVPVFLDGTQALMPEARGFPRLVPRGFGARVRVAFGDPVDGEAAFGDLRRRWRELVRRREEEGGGEAAGMGKGRTGVLEDDELRYGDEARRLRVEAARRVREEVLKLRRGLGGYAEADEALGRAETWTRDEVWRDAREERYTRSRVEGSRVEQD